MRKKYSKERFYKKLPHVQREKAVMKFWDELSKELSLYVERSINQEFDDFTSSGLRAVYLNRGGVSK